MSKDAPLPAVSKPRMVLRVGFAGKRELHPELKEGENPTSPTAVARSAAYGKQLEEVLRIIGRQLIDLTPTARQNTGGVTRYYSDTPPLLRLITGLCEGADTLAFQALERLHFPSPQAGAPPLLDKENAIVIGYGVDDYRTSRRDWFMEEFDRQVRESAYIVTADGIYQEGDEGKNARNRAYRSQADLLLRQSDLLLVMADSSSPGNAGGTMETLRQALSYQLPVILVNVGEPPPGAPKDKLHIRVISPTDNFTAETLPDGKKDWEPDLKQLIRHIVADPQRSEDALEHEQSSHGRDLLEEFLFSENLPPAHACDGGLSWRAFENRFIPRSKPSTPRPAVPAARGIKSKALLDYRKKASSLAGCYSARYRNAFFKNSLYALCAVFLAAGSLLLLVLSHGHPGTGTIITLILLAAVKFALVLTIYRTAHDAIHDHWNDRAVDYRYLAERLRAMDYLPSAGIWQLPASATPLYASRVVRQSAVDWLLNAIIRDTSPRDWADEDRVVRLDPIPALENIKDNWLAEQLEYHKQATRKMQRMELWLRTTGELLNFFIIGIVTVDIIFLAFEAFHLLHPHLVAATPYIVYITAVIPAAVAAINVIRFQSECERLAKRSTVIVRLLGGRPTKPPAKKSGGKSGSHGGHHPHETPHPSEYGEASDKVAEFIGEIWRKALIVAHPAGPALPADSHATPTEGGKIEDARELLELLSTPDEKQLGSASGKVLHFTEECTAIFIQEVAEWSVLYAKELAEP